MAEAINIGVLKSEGILPSDSEIISEHNNLIVSSRKERIVARLASIASIAAREDPGNLVYSHKIAWKMGIERGVVAPLNPEPTIFEGVVVSVYPELDLADWDRVTAEDMYETVHRFNAFQPEDELKVRRADMSYTQQRIDHSIDAGLASSQDVEFVSSQLDVYQQSYPFSQLADDDPAAIHGDLHTGNVVINSGGIPLLIDLDSVAIGPRQSDLASWHVRHARGDEAPTYEMVNIARRQSDWREESFCALVGWKVLSSMTHMIRYGEKSSHRATLNELSNIAKRLGAAGQWKVFDAS